MHLKVIRTREEYLARSKQFFEAFADELIEQAEELTQQPIDDTGHPEHEFITE